MSDDCQDDSDAEDGSFEDLRAEFDDVIGKFKQRAAEDMAKREDAVAVAARSDAEPGGPTFEHKLGAISKQRPFNPQPVLLVPHFKAGEKRPIPQRNQMATDDELDFENDWKPNHPLRSESVTVKTSPDGPETDVIQAENEYAVECTVSNVGGLAARNVNVELYVEHLEPSASIDVNEEELFEANLRYEGHQQWTWYYFLGGVTTMAPDSVLFAQVHDREESPPVESYFHGVHMDVGTAHDGYNRIFFDSEPSRPGDAPDGEEFRVDIWDVSRIKGEISKASLNDAGIPLTQQEGRIVEDGVSYVSRDHELTGEVNTDRRLEKKSVAIPQNESRTVTFNYEPKAGNYPRADLENPEDMPPGAGRSVTVFYVRAYSLATNEVPQVWREIDHTQSRFMARTEVKRTL